MKNQQAHWEKVYQTKGADKVSWFQEHATRSLEIIRSIGSSKDARIIDVGAVPRLWSRICWSVGSSMSACWICLRALLMSPARGWVHLAILWSG